MPICTYEKSVSIQEFEDNEDTYSDECEEKCNAKYYTTPRKSNSIFKILIKNKVK